MSMCHNSLPLTLLLVTRHVSTTLYTVGSCNVKPGFTSGLFYFAGLVYVIILTSSHKSAIIDGYSANIGGPMLDSKPLDCINFD